MRELSAKCRRGCGQGLFLKDDGFGFKACVGEVCGLGLWFADFELGFLWDRCLSEVQRMGGAEREWWCVTCDSFFLVDFFLALEPMFNRGLCGGRDVDDVVLMWSKTSIMPVEAAGRGRTSRRDSCVRVYWYRMEMGNFLKIEAQVLHPKS